MVFVVFCGILIFCYIATKRINPVMLDQQGRPLDSERAIHRGWETLSMTTGATCGLCELPCGRQPVARAYEGSEKLFCCMGCANVYAILLESGVLAAVRTFERPRYFAAASSWA